MAADPDALRMWTVYYNPSDYPGHYVVRWMDIGRGTESKMIGPLQIYTSLERVRASIPRGLHCMARSPGDHPCILETWF